MAARNALTVMAQEKDVRHVKAQANTARRVVVTESVVIATALEYAYSAMEKVTLSATYAMEIKCANIVMGKAT